jgi:hypothetical protein
MRTGIIALIYWPVSYFFFNSGDSASIWDVRNAAPPTLTFAATSSSNVAAAPTLRPTPAETVALTVAPGQLHHPDDVRRLKEMQLALDRVTLEKHQEKEGAVRAASVASESLRSAKDTENKLRLLTQVSVHC